jgi:DNA polymerase I-like protein with 3'-5' exonuclease and polymerase domains
MEYVLLRKQNYLVPSVQLIDKPSNPALLQTLRLLERPGKPIAYDWETTGLSAIKDEAVCLGLSNGRTHVSIRWRSKAQLIYLCHWLLKQRLIGWNYLFDALFITKYSGQVPWPYRDAMVMFKSLANEGWTGQSWSLKTAMTDILGWPETNDVELRAYMKQHKCQMHEVPWPILGRYNALDAAATYQAYEYFESFTAQFPGLVDYWQTEFNNLIAMLTEQGMLGMVVDEDHYRLHDEALSNKQADYLAQFEALVGTHLAAYDAAVVAEIENSPPSALVKKDGTPTVAAERWRARIEEARGQRHFNIDSQQDLCWLFYEALKYPVAKRTAGGKPAVDKKVIKTFGQEGKLLAAYRKTRDQRKFIGSLFDSVIDSRLYCDIRVHGTVTGRCSSGSEV